METQLLQTIKHQLAALHASIDFMEVLANKETVRMLPEAPAQRTIPTPPAPAMDEDIDVFLGSGDADIYEAMDGGTDNSTLIAELHRMLARVKQNWRGKKEFSYELDRTDYLTGKQVRAVWKFMSDLGLQR